jgi:hypothetical protein
MDTALQKNLKTGTLAGQAFFLTSLPSHPYNACWSSDYSSSHTIAALLSSNMVKILLITLLLSALMGASTAIPTFNQGKKLNFRITNVKTGLEEKWDAQKHFFNPYAHHPSLAKEVKAHFTKVHHGKVSPSAFQSRYRTLTRTYDAATHLETPGGAVLDHNEEYVYSNPSVKRVDVLSRHRKGEVKKLKMDKNGEVKLELSDKEKMQQEQDALKRLPTENAKQSARSQSDKSGSNFLMDSFGRVTSSALKAGQSLSKGASSSKDV